MSKRAQFKNFLAKMEWEGGITGLLEWGDLDSGDDELNEQMGSVREAIENVEARIEDLKEEYEIDDEEEEEDE